MNGTLEEIVRRVNVPGKDNGTRFTDPTRRDAVEAVLAHVPRVEVFHRDDYLTLYTTGMHDTGPVVLVSCHLDHVFSRKRLALDVCGGSVSGSLDNAATIACLLYALRTHAFPANVLVSFTGGEEVGYRGARATAAYLRERSGGLFRRIVAVVVTDVTAQNYPLAVSIENLHFTRRFVTGSGIAVRSAGRWYRLLATAIQEAGIPAGYVADAMPDESRAYARRGLNAVSVCLPCDCPRGDVHSVRCRVGLRAMREYARALAVCVRALGAGSAGTDGS